MSLFIRTSSCTFQCTKRVLYNFISTNPAPKRPLKGLTNKRIDSLQIVTSDITISKKLRNNEEIADDHWIEIRKELLDIGKVNGLTEVTLDSLIYDLCESHGRKDQAKNYFKFLERNNYNITLSVLGRYLKLLSSSEKITDSEEQDIYRIYDHIKEKYPVLDARTCTNCMMAIAVTKRWNEAFEMLDMLRFSGTPTSTVISRLCSAAFLHDKPEWAWNLMNEFIKKFPMEHAVYLEYLEYCKRNFKDQNLVEEIEKIFYFWREHYTIPVDFVMEKYMETFSTLGYDSSFAYIRRKEICSKCHTSLQKATVSESDFRILSSSVLKNLVIGKNVYQTTSPGELKRYMHFIKNLQPYDAIVDGLNVAYAKDQRSSLDNVLEVVKMLRTENKRVLVIGRAHLKWQSVETMKKIQQEADVFLVQNMSQDDPFLLHLALVSGPQTYFVSRDLMRQHRFKLENEKLKKLFSHWQLSRQYMIVHDQKTNKVRLLPPVPVEMNAQKVDNGWHIPSTRNAALPLPMTHSISDLWVCLMKKESLKNSDT